LITIDGMNSDGSLHYSIIHQPLRHPFGIGFDADNPSKHEQWFKGGTKVPFCFPDVSSGHDLGFFVLVGKSIVFVAVQFKSYSKPLTPKKTSHALKTLSLVNCYKNKVRPLAYCAYTN
jgi:hypothetical protein